MNPLPGKLQPYPFVRRRQGDYNVRALPGSYLAQPASRL
jgi:hypothetical protein